MKPTVEQKRNEIRTTFSKLIDDNVLMFLALKAIYRHCLKADESNWKKPSTQSKRL